MFTLVPYLLSWVPRWGSKHSAFVDLVLFSHDTPRHMLVGRRTFGQTHREIPFLVRKGYTEGRKETRYVRIGTLGSVPVAFLRAKANTVCGKNYTKHLLPHYYLPTPTPLTPSQPQPHGPENQDHFQRTGTPDKH